MDNWNRNRLIRYVSNTTSSFLIFPKLNRAIPPAKVVYKYKVQNRQLFQIPDIFRNSTGILFLPNLKYTNFFQLRMSFREYSP